MIFASETGNAAGRRPRVWARAIAPIALALIAGAAASDQSVSDHVAAKIGNREITIKQIDTKLAQELFLEEYQPVHSTKLYEARKLMLTQMIDELLLAQVAHAKGVTPEQWMADTVATMAPITDEQIEAVYNENLSRFPEGTSLEELRERLRQYLESQKPMVVMTQLREKFEISQDVPRVRIEVPAIGATAGPAVAPVTIVEFSDFQCPYCGNARTTLGLLRNRFKDELRIVYRHLPLDFHAEAKDAAYASICAEEQGRFWEYHDLLFDNAKALGSEQLVEYAKQIDLDQEAFSKCLASETPEQRVTADLKAAQAAGTRATPTFFVNGIMLTGTPSFTEFESLIQSEIDRVNAAAAATPN